MSEDLQKRLNECLKMMECNDWRFENCASRVVEVLCDDMNEQERNACWTIILYCKRKAAEASRKWQLERRIAAQGDNFDAAMEAVRNATPTVS